MIIDSDFAHQSLSTQVPAGGPLQLDAPDKPEQSSPEDTNHWWYSVDAWLDAKMNGTSSSLGKKVYKKSKDMWSFFKPKARSRIIGPGGKFSKLTWVKVARWVAIIGAVGAVLGVFLFFVLIAWYSRDLPKPGEVVRRSGFSTKIYDRNGALLYDLYGDERRDPSNITEMPLHLKQATIAIEDKDFYAHEGFDWRTIVRIPYYYITDRRLVGGSTLTQQLVKKALFTDERSVERKFKELVLSLQIERTFTKDQILEMYLNEIPYGGTAYGVAAAAKVYFDKPVSELNIVESAIIAGLPQSPSRYSPYAGRTTTDGEPLWKFRAKGVLRRMYEDGYLTQLAYDQAVSELDTIVFNKAASEIKAPHFSWYVRDVLAEQYGEEFVDTAGLRVTTSLDLKLQEKVQEIVATEIATIEAKFHITNGAVLVMNPKTGEILTMVGSRDFNNTEMGGQFNVVVDGLRQPGSSIKPLTYLALLRKGYTPASVLADVQTSFQENDQMKPYEPKNYDGKFRGPVSIRESLGNSLNIPAVKALAIVGVEEFLTFAEEVGLPTLAPTSENLKRFGLSTTLGGAEVHMIELVSAYSSFANGGTKVEPVSILKIEDKDGNVLYQHHSLTGRQVMTPQETFLINHILSDNSARQASFGPNSLLNTAKPIAVKTGTTNSLKDNWAIGWSNGSFIVGSWVGNNDGTSMKAVVSGISGATPIWRKTVNALVELEYPTPDWEIPDGVEEVEVDTVSGYPFHSGFGSRKEYVISGTLPALPDPVHTKLKLCRGENKLAPEARVSSGEYDEKEFVALKESDPYSKDGKNRWQEAIDAWIQSQGDEKYKVPTEYCGDVKEVYIRLNKPETEKSYSEEEIEVQVESSSPQGIEKIEILVNNEVRETVNQGSYTGKIKLPKGRYEIWARSYSRDGQVKESGKARIGTGGEDWKEADKPKDPPKMAISFPSEGQAVEQTADQQFCVVDVPADGGNNSGLQRRYSINNASWTEFAPLAAPVCYTPPDGENTIQFKYRNSDGIESENYTRKFTFKKI